MLLTIGVNLFAARIILTTLGVEDYGIFTVVGGVVALFSFMNAAMASASQRYLAFELGKGDLKKLRNVFNTSILIHLAIGITTILVAESIGLWFINNKLNVPADRLPAVNWVFQFSLLSFLVGVIKVPYHALIIAREKMSIYALLSITEVILKLLIVFLLIISPFDKLKSYALLFFLIVLLNAFLYKIYCNKYFSESKFIFYYDKILFRNLISYSGWNLFGNVAAVGKGQGLNVVLNLIFGPVVNAAYGITLQVQTTLYLFITNFQVAVNPQIVKSYALKNKLRCAQLIIKTAKYSYFLLFIIVIPIIYNLQYLLAFWLGTPPQYALEFVRLCLINMLIDCISGPLMTGIQATGRIKWYQSIVGTLVFLNLPLSYLFLKLYGIPEIIYYVSIIISLLSLTLRIYFNRNLVLHFPIIFYKSVISKILLITGIGLLAIYILRKFLFEIGFHQGIITMICMILIIAIIVGMLGTTKIERNLIFKIFQNQLKRNEVKTIN